MMSQPETARAVSLTLRLVSHWLSSDEEADLLRSAAAAIEQWTADGMSCPLCQHSHESNPDYEPYCPLYGLDAQGLIGFPHT